MKTKRFHATLLTLVALSGLASFVGIRARDLTEPVHVLSTTRVNNLEITGTTDATGVVTARAGVRLTTPTTGPLFSSGTGSPNGVVSATQGSVFLRTDTAQVYQNTDGAMAWTQIGAGTTTQTPFDTYYGIGRDGDVNFDGTSVVNLGMAGTSYTPTSMVYNLDRIIFVNNFNCAAGVVINVRGGAIYINGTINSAAACEIRAVGSDASGSTGGAASSGANPYVAAGAGGTSTGGSGSSCSVVATASTSAALFAVTCTAGTCPQGGSNGVNGGTGGRGQGGGGGGGFGAAGCNSPAVAISDGWTFVPGGSVGMGRAFTSNPGNQPYTGSTSGGGGGGSPDPGTGGGGGGGAGWVWFIARNCNTSNSLKLKAYGGNGGTASGTRSGGGGGGGGGYIFAYCGTGTLPDTGTCPGSGGGSTGTCYVAGGAAGPKAAGGTNGDGGRGGDGWKTTYSPTTGLVNY